MIVITVEVPFMKKNNILKMMYLKKRLLKKSM